MTPACRRRGLLAAAAFFALELGVAPAAHAQHFPAKPIRLVVPFAVGGGTDILARDLAPRLAEALGQPVVVDNKGGAGGNIGSDHVARSTADGYTILFGSNSLTINASLYANLPFDPIKSFTPVGMVATAPLVLVVHNESPVTSVRALITEAKAKPGKLNWSAPGNGTPHHLASELFNSMAGVDMLHIQYKGGGAAVTDLLGGQTQAGILTLSSVRSFISTGKLRALGVATAKRTPLLPEVPTIAEAGVPGYEVNLWYGLFVPANTPQQAIATLNTALNKVLAAKEIQEKFNAQGYDLQPGSPTALGALVKADLARSAKVIADSHIKVD